MLLNNENYISYKYDKIIYTINDKNNFFIIGLIFVYVNI